MTESMTESERRGADPTANVTAVLNAAIQRQDDLRDLALSNIEATP